jgi:hypothetical protein
MNKQYLITLNDDERESPQQLVSKGKASARAIGHARILLKADIAEDWNDEQISQDCEVSQWHQISCSFAADPVRPDCGVPLQ